MKRVHFYSEDDGFSPPFWHIYAKGRGDNDFYCDLILDGPNTPEMKVAIKNVAKAIEVAINIPIPPTGT